MSVTSQRSARVFAMQLLYAMNITAATVAQCIDGVLKSQEITDEMKRYGMTLVDLVQEHSGELDEEIGKLSIGWDLARIAKLDRLILQVAMVELLYRKDIPTKVAIQEAVQIANKYSTEESFRFVNGILNQFARNRNMILNKENSEECVP